MKKQELPHSWAELQQPAIQAGIPHGAAFRHTTPAWEKITPRNQYPGKEGIPQPAPAGSKGLQHFVVLMQEGGNNSCELGSSRLASCL